MTAPIAYTVLGPLAGLAIAVIGVPVESPTQPAPQVATANPAGAAETIQTEQPPSQHPLPDSLEDGVEDVVRRVAAQVPVEQRETLDYWTPERMAAANPRPHLLDGAAPSVPLPPLETEPEPLSAPSPNSTGKRWTGGGRVAATTGRVYLTMNNADYTCSASVVAAANRDTVLTAGHCLKDGKGSWASNWMFVPGYNDGAQPYGRYPAREMVVSAKWSREADDSYDFGMAVLNTDSAGRHVEDRTGAQRVVFDNRIAPQVYSFGYPSEPPYTGSHLYYCSGPTRPDPGGTTGSGIRCTMTQGSSGGPWFTDFNPATGTGTIVSVISFKYANNINVQYGPRLGPEAKDVYETAQRL